MTSLPHDPTQPVIARRLAAAGQVRETLEAHLYAFLTQRFGLRPLIRGALAGLLAALGRHAAADAEADLFGRVLRRGIWCAYPLQRS
jgi:hypothetical protein